MNEQIKHPIVMIRGGGDLASGVAICLFRAGYRVVITELSAPLVVRRKVAFAQAVFDGSCQVEEVQGELTSTAQQAMQIMEQGKVAVMVDPQAETVHNFPLVALVDCRMNKAISDQKMDAAPLVIGLGPGFSVGVNCHAVIETKRGSNLGKIILDGGAESDSGIPEPVNGFARERVLYSPVDGQVIAKAKIGDVIEPGETIATIGEELVVARFKGVLRGLIQNGIFVKKGVKIGDLDPRCEVDACYRVSDKAMAIGAAVVKAIQMASSNQ